MASQHKTVVWKPRIGKELTDYRCTVTILVYAGKVNVERESENDAIKAER